MKKIIIANWKMKLSYPDSLVLARKLVENYQDNKNKIIICPEYLALPAVAAILKGSAIYLGAQDSAITDFGAYTGEVSPRNLKLLGAKYVILGHSERRTHFHENSAIINAKILAALNNKLIPILCIGEKLAERESSQTKEVIVDELRRALKGVKIKTEASLIIAYEPVWAIGNGRTIDPIIAAEIQEFISQQAFKILKKKVAVIYGGSVNAQNASAFLAQPAIAGLLVVTASWKLAEFLKIISINKFLK